MVYFLLFFTFCILVIFTVFSRKRKRKRLECPGPNIVEILIGFVRMKNQMHLLLFKWAEKYGRIFCMCIGSKRFFFMNDVDLVREVFGNIETSWRPYVFTFDPFCSGIQGILTGNGKGGQIHRNFVLSSLRAFGVGRPQMTENLTGEIKEMISEILVKSGKGDAICVRAFFMRTITNSLWLSIASKRFSQEDPTMAAISTFLESFDSTSASSLSMLFAASLRPLWPFIPVFKRFQKVHKQLSDKMEQLVLEHHKTWRKDAPRDLVDAYFDKMDEETQDEKSYFYKGKSLVHDLIHLVIAGTHTTTLTMEWAILEMVRNPKIQLKISEEFSRVLAEGEAPSLAHRPKLPYTEATVLEILRLHPVASQGINHLTTEDIQVDGFFVPKNSEILASIFYIQNNKKIWGEDADLFRPERWLVLDPLDRNGNGNMTPTKNLEYFMTFSSGRRKCPGGQIARELLFLLLSNILYRFIIRKAPGQPMPKLENDSSLLLVPRKYSVLFVPR